MVSQIADEILIGGEQDGVCFDGVAVQKQELEKVIRHEGSKWILYSHDGSKHLGTFDTKEEALDRERQIQYFKHVAKSDLEMEFGKRLLLSKDNPCHKPAGTSEGGQFCEIGATGGAGIRDLGTASDREIAKFERPLFEEWESKLDKNERLSVDRYTDHHYLIVNKELRESNITPGNKYLVEDLDSAINKSRLSGGVAVYRGLGMHGANLADMNIGATFIDKAFVSTSLKVRVANHAGEGQAIARISLKAGQRAAPVSGLSIHNREAEMLLPRDSTFRVTGKTVVGGVHYVELEML